MSTHSHFLPIMPPDLFQCEDDILQFLDEQKLRVLKPLAQGAQGTVFALTSVVTNTVTNVLKITPPGNLSQSYHPDKGLHLVMNIKHPNICSPLKLFYLNPKHQISFFPSLNSTCIASIMPYVEGSTLQAAKPTIVENAKTIFFMGLRVADALQALRKEQVEHSDLHAKNILIDRNLEPILIDFDLCEKRVSSSRDTHELRHELNALISNCPNIKPGAKEFLLSCTSNPQLNTPELAKTFMEACMDHLDEIKLNLCSKL